ncbi:GNAT family N-acetyltransferase [Streptomyces albipurpureus]|uniref:GNAT family N-acetyltransferase n=1 Tax=Streptomyces albipurpureus TaxID=2897419 RepID=A0ABT0UXR8_9ACTN|nr:GNAT family N-acetyltransferase [Streptomyces sp. CWNU-1]MCM2392754.1 GNAT family N-acetyltransferase [Streptomyces sp. CWNU-1]
MTTALPRPAVQSAHSSARQANHLDAVALHTLSQQFFPCGALRERTLGRYSADAADFFVADLPRGALAGCLGLRDYPDEPTGPSGVLYNFCVAPTSQGQGVGSGLLRAALAHASARSLRAVFTATTGGGALFLRHGFTPVDPGLAPRAWVGALDPRRGSTVLARILST